MPAPQCKAHSAPPGRCHRGGMHMRRMLMAALAAAHTAITMANLSGTGANPQ